MCTDFEGNVIQKNNSISNIIQKKKVYMKGHFRQLAVLLQHLPPLVATPLLEFKKTRLKFLNLMERGKTTVEKINE